MKKVIMASFAVLCVAACDEEAKADSKAATEQKASAKETSAPANTFTDPRDGKKYRYVKIDEQVWMAENLNYGGNDGNFGICYNNLPENCKKYGGLYGFQQTYEACPPGWHIPSHTEWETLMFFAASESNGAGSGQALKSKTGWKQAINNRGEAMPGGSDIYGFSALPGGAAEGIYLAIGEAGTWWYSGEGGVGFVEMMYNSPKAKREVGFVGAEVANKAYSIRCVKDSPERIAAQKAAVEAAAKAAAEAKAQLQKWDKQPLEGGKEYTWSEAMKACPKGKHLPTNDEWNKLEEPLSQLSKSEFSSEIEKEYFYDEKIRGWSATRKKLDNTHYSYDRYTYFSYTCSLNNGCRILSETMVYSKEEIENGPNKEEHNVRCVKD
jgi:uncharacterized protein (TIGR02145 family)